MTQKHWIDFIEKVNFAELTSRWNVVPLHWLEDIPPQDLGAPELELYQKLTEIPKDLEEEARNERVCQSVKSYRKALASYSMLLEQDLVPAGSRVILRYLNPDDLGSGDCLISLGSWDRVGHFIIEKAGLTDEEAISGENPLRRDSGSLGYRDLLIFPDKGTPSPRAFRVLCEKTFRQALGLGARRISLTHLTLPQTGLPDRFAAAEVVSAVRQMLREREGLTIEIMPFTASNFADYRHWFLSLAELNKGAESSNSSSQMQVQAGQEDIIASEPVFAQAVLDIAQKTTSLAQEAGREVFGWFRQATSSLTEEPPAPAAPQVKPENIKLNLSFEQQQVLNLLYLGKWRQAEAYASCWQENSLVSLYITALYKVVSYLDLCPAKDSSVEKTDRAEDLESPLKKKTRAKAKKKSKNKTQLLEEVGPSTSVPTQPLEPTKIEAPAVENNESKEYQELHNSLLLTAEQLGSENPLSRYFLLLAWRLDRRQPSSDPELLEEDHARLLRAAWAWEDQALLDFLRSLGQEQESSCGNKAAAEYFPVFPMGSRNAPRVD